MPAAIPLAIVGSTVAGAAISSSAAQKAAKTQANAAQQASNQQLDMFNTIRGDLSPYRDIGSTALPGLSRLLGLTGTSLGPTGAAAVGMNPRGAATSSPIYAVDPATGQPIVTGGGQAQTAAGAYGYDPMNFDAREYLKENPDIGRAYQAFIGGNSPYQELYAGVQSPEEFAWRHYQLQGVTEGRPAATGTEASLAQIPGYQFARDQGVQQVGRQLGTKGLTGAQAKGIARFVTGLADQTYGEQVQRYMDLAKLGSNAATQTGTFGQTAATNSGNALIGGANAQAAGQVGAANAIGGALGSIPSALLTNKLLSGGIYGTGSSPASVNVPGAAGTYSYDYGVG